MSELTKVILEREVDSGLDETSSLSPSLTEDIDGVESQRVWGSSIHQNKDLKTKDEDTSVRIHKHSYFKSPLELELENKLQLLCANGRLLRNIKTSEVKHLTQAQENLEAEFQTTRDVWKRLYFDSKSKSIPLDQHVQTKKNELEKYRDEILKRMKTKVVERSKQRNASDTQWRKRNLLQRRESRVNKHGRTQKASPLDVNRQLLHDDFSLRMEAIKVDKLARRTDNVRILVQKAQINLRETEDENRKEREEIEELRKELEAVKLEKETVGR